MGAASVLNYLYTCLLQFMAVGFTRVYPEAVLAHVADTETLIE